MFIAGTIRNSVNLAVMDSKWQQKKQEVNKDKNKNMTAQERRRQEFQEQVDQIRENRKPALIDAKLESGGKLSPEEIEYLKKHDPEALKEYQEVQRERENYEKQLKNCKSKEEVEKLKMTKMGQFLSEAKTIINNPYIPKGEKYKLMKKMLKKTAGIEAEHEKFLQSQRYAELPDEEREARRKKRSEKEMQEEQAEDTSLLPSLSEDYKSQIEEIRKEIAQFGLEQNTIDISDNGVVQIDTAADSSSKKSVDFYI